MIIVFRKFLEQKLILRAFQLGKKVPLKKPNATKMNRAKHGSRFKWKNEPVGLNNGQKSLFLGSLFRKSFPKVCGNFCGKLL